MVYAPTEVAAPSELLEIARSRPADGEIRIQARGETLEGDPVNVTVLLPLGATGDAVTRLAHAGLEVRDEDSRMLIDNIVFGSHAERAGLDFDWEITGVEMAADRPPKQLMFVPALIILGLLGLVQRARRSKLAATTARA